MDEHDRPIVDSKEIHELLRSAYGINVISMTELNSGEDRNFLLKCLTRKNQLNASCSLESNLNWTSIGNKNGPVQRGSTESEPYDGTSLDGPYVEFVLKVMREHDHNPDSDSILDSDNCRELSTASRIELQMKLMSRLSERRFICPEPIGALNGSCIQRVFFSKEKFPCLVYLTKYIPGCTLFDHIQQSRAPLSKEVLFDIGRLLASLHEALTDIGEEKLQLQRTSSPWDLKNADQLLNFINDDDKNNEQITLATEVVTKFCTDVLPNIGQLPEGIIHSDFHDEKYIVSK